MTLSDLGLALVGGGVAGMAAGGLCGGIIGHKKIGLTLAGLMGMFYGALATSGVGLALILSLIIA